MIELPPRRRIRAIEIVDFETGRTVDTVELPEPVDENTERHVIAMYGQATKLTAGRFLREVFE